MTSHDYQVSVSWQEERKGRLCSPDLLTTNTEQNTCFEVATPPEFPKGMPGIWSPEHLFTAAVSSCLMTTFLAIAENSRLDFISFSCDAKGTLAQADGKFKMTEVALFPKVVITHPSDYDKALKVLAKSEAACLISHSITSKVTMTPQVEVQQG